MGISAADFPYELPKKGGIFSSKSKLAFDRRTPLQKFLNAIVGDREMQNMKAVHDFLDLPRNFNFTALSNSDTNEDAYLLGFTAEGMTDHSWLSTLRMIKGTVSRLETTNVTAKIASQRKADEYILPALSKLEIELNRHLSSKVITKSEYDLRCASLTAVRAEILKKLVSTEPNTYKREWLQVSEKNSESTFAAKESNQTIALSNTDLMQKQLQVHKEQDQELEQLRKAILNQKRIGEAIHKEVSEQNEILDALNAEAEAAASKLESARLRTRRIG